MKKIIVSIVLLVACSLTLDLQAGCDTQPDPGQTVGRCKEVNDPDYSYYACRVTYAEGEICYFNAPPT